MYRKVYECQVKIWQSDATGKRALKWMILSEHIDEIRRSNDRL